MIPLMSLKEKLKGQNMKAVFWYHETSRNGDIEKIFDHMLFSFYQFCMEEYLKLPPITETYFEKLQQPWFLDVISSNRSMMEPFSIIVPCLIQYSVLSIWWNISKSTIKLMHSYKQKVMKIKNK